MVVAAYQHHRQGGGSDGHHNTGENQRLGHRVRLTTKLGKANHHQEKSGAHQVEGQQLPEQAIKPEVLEQAGTAQVNTSEGVQQLRTEPGSPPSGRWARVNGAGTNNGSRPKAMEKVSTVSITRISGLAKPSG